MESQTTTTATDAWTMYIYSLKSPVSKQKYPKRLATFFAFAGMPQNISIEEQSKLFVAKATATDNSNWAFNTILKFVMAQLERVNRKEIVIATLRGYLKSIKLFCDVAEVPVGRNLHSHTAISFSLPGISANTSNSRPSRYGGG